MQLEEKDWLEQQLRAALERQDPPEGFAGRVADRLAAEGPDQRRDRGKVIAWPSRPIRRLLAAAAAIVLMAGGAAEYRRHQGEVAKRELMRAFYIAGGKLNHVQARVLEVSQ